jgi:hypothetical protein
MFLKHTIDTINVFRAFSERLSKATRSPLGGLAVILLAGLLLFATVHKVEGQSAPAPAQMANAQEESVASDQMRQQKSGSSSGGHAQSGVSTDNTAGQDVQSGSQADTKAASGSGADQATSFSTRITANGQVAAGMLIAYDAAKHYKTFYGGDLTVSASSVTISKAATAPQAVTVSTADGATVTVPIIPDDDSSQYFQASLDSDASDVKAASSFAMRIQAVDVRDIPVGSYQIHLSTLRSANQSAQGQITDLWAYHVFITVNVTE